MPERISGPPSGDPLDKLDSTQKIYFHAPEEPEKTSQDVRGSAMGRIVASIPGYAVIKELGKGGYGVVYLAKDVQFGKKLAIKVLKPQLIQTDVHLARFKREASLACKLRHPHIVRVYNSGEIQGLHYLVMEYIEGRSLLDLMRKKDADLQSLVRILREALLGLGYAHQNGVMHRDLKPGNIMVEEATGRAVVMDFGLAKPEESGETVTGSNVVLGTPVYMSPEQVRGSHSKPDRRADLYSMGVILYEMATGRLPFDAETTVGILRRVLEDQPVPPRRVNASLSQDLENVILKAIDKAREDRYQTAESFIEDLDAILSGRSPSAPPRGASSPLAVDEYGKTAVHPQKSRWHPGSWLK